MTTDVPEFRTVMRGYARGQVDALIERAGQVLTSSTDPAERAAMRKRLLEAGGPAGEARFDTALRGYHRAEVDAYLEELASRLD
jgi:DivIVA domain-containing protein